MKMIQPIHEHEFTCECGHLAEYTIYKTSRAPHLYHLNKVLGKTFPEGSPFFGKVYYQQNIRCREKGCSCRSPVWNLSDGRTIKWSEEFHGFVEIKDGKVKML